MAKPAKKAAKKSQQQKPAKAPAQRIVRSEATVQAQMQKSPDTACFEVLTPFKFQGATVKPPMLVEMTDAEAAQYQEAGVLGTDPHDVPVGGDMNDDDGDGGAGGVSPAGDPATPAAQ